MHNNKLMTTINTKKKIYPIRDLFMIPTYIRILISNNTGKNLRISNRIAMIVHNTEQ